MRWRGLHYLVNNTETDEMLKIRVMNISKKELGKTLKKFKGTAWDQSPIFKKVYEEEYGQFGGEPFGCWSATTTSTTARRTRAAGRHGAGRGGGARAVHRGGSTDGDADGILAGAGQSARSDEDLSDAGIRRLALAARVEDSRYIGLCMPRFLARLPYGAKTDPVEEFDFEEDTTAPSSEKYAWSNAAYAMATNINRSFKLYGWCSHIRGIESGGAVEGLPTHTFPTTTAAWT